MPKVLVYAPMVGRGGVHLVVENLTRGFAQYAPEQWSFAVLGQRYDEYGMPINWPDEWEFEQIDPVPRPPIHPSLFPFLVGSVDHFVSHLKRKAKDFDLIYCVSPWWTIRTIREPFQFDIPFVVSLPDFAFDTIDMGGLTSHFRVTAQAIGEKGLWVIYSSEIHRKHGERRYRILNGRVVPNSSDFGTHDADTSEKTIDQMRDLYHLPEKYVLAFHCAYHKDPVTILRGQNYARSISPNVPPLVMAGVDTQRFIERRPSDDSIRSVQQTMRMQQIKLGEDLWVLGYIPDDFVAALHHEASLVVVASRSEGDLSGSMLSAIQAKVPLVYSDLPVFLERMPADEELGYVFPVGKYRDLGMQIATAMNNTTESERRAQRAYDKITAYTLRDVVSGYLNVFMEALNAEGN